ncbi:MAG: M23 family metallopeptidase [Treponema sp.]|jgi:murein DD-endopeptidase MepM/ murein hydrolase activator NlpD|nr:M23 family metallopeptidase [Treponema sp.]
MSGKRPVKAGLFLFLILPFLVWAEPGREKSAPKQPSPVAPAEPVPGLPSIHFPADPVQVSVPPLRPLQGGPGFAAIPASPRAGEPVTVAYTDDFSGPGSREFQAVLLDSQGKRIAKALFFSFAKDAEGRDVLAAILGIPSTAGAGPFFIRVEAPGRTIQDIPILVEKRDFISETIALDEENTAIRTQIDPQKTREAEQLWAILNHTGADIFTSGPFIPPVASTRRTSFFGDRRIYQYVSGSSDTSIHAGVDYGVPKGTEVWACAPGRVVLARPRIVTGNSVILEHLPGVYSLYYHLDTIEAQEGAIVSAGTLLGLSGSTGLATGPHLHWEIRTAGENTDPDAFISRAVLDKDEILSKLIRY